MGQSVGLKSQSAPLKAASAPKPLRLGVDVIMVMSVMMLLSFGILMVYSASWQPSMLRGEDPGFYLLNQLKWVALGVVACTVAMYVDYRRWRKLMVLLIIVIIGLLILVLLIGETRYGSRRTMFGGSIQPSDLARRGNTVYLAFWLTSKKEILNQVLFGLVPLMLILGIIIGLIFLQPDLSAMVTVLAIGILLFFLAGVDLKNIILMVLIVAVMGVIFIGISDTGQTRIAQYISGLQDPISASDHIKRSFESIVRGGFFGVGIGRGTSKFALPVSHTDSIFAVIAEETGLLGSSLLVVLFIVFMWRGLTIANRATDPLGRILAAGLTLWITMEAILNMGVMVNVFPFAGNALPFISAGGSSMLMTMTAVGLILSVSRVSSREKATQDGRSYGAVVNLRRGDGRRSVSRTHRTPGTRQ